MNIPFNKPHLTGKELGYIEEAVNDYSLSGDKIFTKKCNALLETKFNAKKALLTTSCTHAIELSALLFELQPGDEVIVPSYTFVSTVNPILLRGAKPVFVDIEEQTLNLDLDKVEDLITEKTKAIFPVHYAGISCDMDKLMRISKKHDLFVMEDAAQAVNAKYKDRYLGTMGGLGAYSFHETKNFVCGEGGALLINNNQFLERAEIIREKGTNRSKFLRGEIDKYTWVDFGSSYLPSDLLAAFLYAQLEQMTEITKERKRVFERYYSNLKELEDQEKLRSPFIPSFSTPNYHMFYIILNSYKERSGLMKELKKKGINSVSHYIPLHSSPMGKKLGYKEEDLPITEDLSARLLRLPMYVDLKNEEVDFVCENIKKLI